MSIFLKNYDQDEQHQQPAVDVGRHPQHYLPPHHHQPLQDMLCPDEDTFRTVLM